MPVSLWKHILHSSPICSFFFGWVLILPLFTLAIVLNTRSITLTRKSLRGMATPILYTPVHTEDTSPPPLYNKEASSDDESTEYTVVRRRKLTILHWIAHGINLAVIVFLAIRVWASEPLQSRCHKLFNYYCMISMDCSLMRTGNS
jgi:hypothetical protein